jgi:hypothetical protein
VPHSLFSMDGKVLELVGEICVSTLAVSTVLSKEAKRVMRNNVVPFSEALVVLATRKSLSRIIKNCEELALVP